MSQERKKRYLEARAFTRKWWIPSGQLTCDILLLTGSEFTMKYRRCFISSPGRIQRDGIHIKYQVRAEGLILEA